jgi:hypothetical protein
VFLGTRAEASHWLAVRIPQAAAESDFYSFASFALLENPPSMGGDQYLVIRFPAVWSENAEGLCRTWQSLRILVAHEPAVLDLIRQVHGMNHPKRICAAAQALVGFALEAACPPSLRRGP